MANIRWRPLLDTERLFDELHMLGHHTGTDMATDIYEDEKNVFVEINIPGIQPDKIDISIHHDHLRVSGSREEAEETEDKDYYHREIRRGSFERVLTLPCEVDEEKATAEFTGGVLCIVLPKKEAPTEHKIKVKSK